MRPRGDTVPAEVATTAAPSVTPQRSVPLPRRPLPAPGVQPPAPAVAAQLALDLLSPQAGSSALSPRQGFGLGRGSSAEVPADIVSPRQWSGGRSSSTTLPVGIPGPRQRSGGRSSSTALPVGIPGPQQGPAQRRRTKAELQTGILSPQGHGCDGRSGSAILQVSPRIAHSKTGFCTATVKPSRRLCGPADGLSKPRSAFCIASLWPQQRPMPLSTAPQILRHRSRRKAA